MKHFEKVKTIYPNKVAQAVRKAMGYPPIPTLQIFKDRSTGKYYRKFVDER